MIRGKLLNLVTKTHIKDKKSHSFKTSHKDLKNIVEKVLSFYNCQSAQNYHLENSIFLEAIKEACQKNHLIFTQAPKNLLLKPYFFPVLAVANHSVTAKLFFPQNFSFVCAETKKTFSSHKFFAQHQMLGFFSPQVDQVFKKTKLHQFFFSRRIFLAVLSSLMSFLLLAAGFALVLQEKLIFTAINAFVIFLGLLLFGGTFAFLSAFLGLPKKHYGFLALANKFYENFLPKNTYQKFLSSLHTFPFLQQKNLFTYFVSLFTATCIVLFGIFWPLKIFAIFMAILSCYFAVLYFCYRFYAALRSHDEVKQKALQGKLERIFDIYKTLLGFGKIPDLTAQAQTNYFALEKSRTRLNNTKLLTTILTEGLPLFLLLVFFFLTFLSWTPLPQSVAFLSMFLVSSLGFFGRKALQENFLKVSAFTQDFLEKHETKPLLVDIGKISGEIQVKNLSVNYYEHQVLENLSFNISPGEFVGVLGPSGSGKSTLLNVLSLNLKAPSGSLFFDGQDAASLNKDSVKKHMGGVFQESQLFEGSILENLACGDIDVVTADKILLWLDKKPIFNDLFSLPLKLNTYVFWHQQNLSFYHKFLILLARELLQEPKVLFLDEPFCQLEASKQNALFYFLKEQGITTFLASHLLEQEKLRKNFCNKVIRLPRIC